MNPQEKTQDTSNLPLDIYTGKWTGGHIQGIAIDQKRHYIYCSFTTELVKLDLQGNIIGSVKGFTGHLGCLAYNAEDGRIYGSLEYKNDSVGQGILNRLGVGQVTDAFYIAIFDVEKIIRPDMNAETDGIMTTVWLKEVLEDYKAEWNENGKEIKHRYGCSGIDGITFAPAFEGDGMRLYVAYGIYGETDRDDNDNQVLLSYKPEDLSPFETVLTAHNIHTNGPSQCDIRYFVPTGNTTFGIQNMEYDSFTGNIFLSVYPGKKEKYPNFPLYVIDTSKVATDSMLSLKETGLYEKGCYGYRFPYGATGMASLGDGYFYISENGGGKGQWDSHICLYRFTGDPEQPFEKVIQ